MFKGGTFLTLIYIEEQHFYLARRLAEIESQTKIYENISCNKIWSRQKVLPLSTSSLLCHNILSHFFGGLNNG